MTAFPTLIPSTRTFTPGEYPHTAYQAYSGQENRVRHSNVMLSSTLRLGFVALPEDKMLAVQAHYEEKLGVYDTFEVSSDTFSNQFYTLANYLWRYQSTPSIEEVPLVGFNVTVVLESVPPQGAFVSGLIS
jgi:hypothetical protein